MTRKCASCGTENDGSAKFCRNCGSTALEGLSLAEAGCITCPSCGAACKARARFCLKCGAKLEVESSPVAADCAVDARPAERVTVRPPPPVMESPAPPSAHTPPAPPPPPLEPAKLREPVASRPITASPEDFPSEPEAASRSSSTTYMVFGVLLLALAGAGGYFYWSLTKAKELGQTEAPAARGGRTAPQSDPAPPVAAVPAEPVKAGGEAPAVAAPVPSSDPGAAPAGSPTTGVTTSPIELAPRPEPKKPTRPAPPRPKRDEVAPKPATQPAADNSSKSAEQLRREIEEELRGVTRKN